MADWVIRFIEQHGYVGIALLMLAKNVFPPLPSELIMPFAAFQAARGQLLGAGHTHRGTGLVDRDASLVLRRSSARA